MTSTEKPYKINIKLFNSNDDAKTRERKPAYQGRNKKTPENEREYRQICILSPE